MQPTKIVKKMNRIFAICAIMAAVAVAATGEAYADDKYERVNTEWQAAVAAAIDSFPEGGGYYTGRNTNAQFRRTAWRQMNEAFGMDPTDSQPRLNVSAAVPSFDAMAIYLALLKSIQVWDGGDGRQDVPNLSWFSMKPFCGVTDVINNRGYTQADGEGLWGMAKANGPGIAVIVKELGAGFSFMGYRGAKTEAYREDKKERYLSDEEWVAAPVWPQARKGDFMKIFWNRNDSGSDCGAIIGDNGKPGEEQECSTVAIFMGYDGDGNVMYWSSNDNAENPVNGGYGVAVCRRTDIQRVVFTRIMEPEKFAYAKDWRASKVHKWLRELGGKRHGTGKELKKQCGID